MYHILEIGSQTKGKEVKGTETHNENENGNKYVNVIDTLQDDTEISTFVVYLAGNPKLENLPKGTVFIANGEMQESELGTTLSLRNISVMSSQFSAKVEIKSIGETYGVIERSKENKSQTKTAKQERTVEQNQTTRVTMFQNQISKMKDGKPSLALLNMAKQLGKTQIEQILANMAGVDVPTIVAALNL